MDDFKKFNDFVKQFTDDTIPNVRKVGRNYYYVEENVWKLKDTLSRDIYSIGIFLGEEKGVFVPSPALLEMISALEGARNRKIYVNKKAEWLFLCGRSILESSISRNPNNISEGSVLVQNENDENLGYGFFKQEGPDLVIRRLLDRGNYLRIEDKKGRARNN